MKIDIVYDTNRIKRELPFIASNIAYFEKNKMFSYFPFKIESNIDLDEIDRQIIKDENHFQITTLQNTICEEWAKKEALVFKYLNDFNKVVNVFEFENEYTCFLTFYGCYGYYDYPNEIYVNVDAKPEFIIETIVHELIHLLIQKKMGMKPHQEIEEFVDDVFKSSGLAELFTNYESQKF